MSNDNLEVAKELHSRLISHGFAVIFTKDGKRLSFITEKHIGQTGQGIMIALEGGGCHWWSGATIENEFRLISSGFDMINAATLADTLNCLYELCDGEGFLRARPISNSPHGDVK